MYHSLLKLAVVIPTAISTVHIAVYQPDKNGNNTETDHDSCHNPLVRQEWRTLSNDQKADYIRAVKCLQTIPAKTSFNGVKTRFDDFQALHIALTAEIHLVGQFLPWHRRFLKVYENTLREECHYKDAHPYWDWTRDADNSSSFSGSPIFDPETGFGGNGADTGDGCVTDGPFASYNLSVGPGTNVTNHCLQRSFNDWALEFISSTQVKNTTKLTSFEAFHIELEGTPVTPTFKIHDGGHVAIGGEMGNRDSSPGDPLFYLHHGNLDRIWWGWQATDLTNRLYDISGRSTVDPPYVNVTLDFSLKMSNIAPVVTIRDVMDIRNEQLCYKYI